MEPRDRLFEARDKLTEQEAQALRHELERSAEGRRALREELELDQLLRISQNPARRRFVERVLQRAGRTARPAAGNGAPRRYTAAAIQTRTWGWWITGIAACALIGIGLLLNRQFPQIRKHTRRQQTVASLTRVRGHVFLVRAQTRRTIDAPTDLRTDDKIIATGQDAQAVVRYKDGTTHELLGYAELRLPMPGLSDGPRLFLAAGRLDSDVAPQAPDRPLIVDTPHVEITVVGTRFTTVVQHEATRVDLEEGRVRLRNKTSGKLATLDAGHRAVAAGRTLVTERPVPGRPGRVRRDLIALYLFDEGAGRVVHDRSGFRSPLDLEIEDTSAVRWLPEQGLELAAPTLISSRRPAAKITEACRAANEFTVETWIRPALESQGDNDKTGAVRIVSISEDYQGRNLGVGQMFGAYVLRFSTQWPKDHYVRTKLGVIRTELQHVVFTRNNDGDVRCYLDGRPSPCLMTASHSVPAGPPAVPGRLSAWQRSRPLLLGNELLRERAWLGQYRLVALYSRALSQTEVAANHRAGIPRGPSRKVMTRP